MSFIQYDKPKKRGRIPGDKPMLTVGKTGVLGLNLTAVTRWRLRQFGYATLYYNSQSKMIGIKPSNDAIPENFKLRDRKGSGLDISARSFLQNFEIDFSETRRYSARWDEESEMLIAEVGR